MQLRDAPPASTDHIVARGFDQAPPSQRVRPLPLLSRMTTRMVANFMNLQAKTTRPRKIHIRLPMNFDFGSCVQSPDHISGHTHERFSCQAQKRRKLIHAEARFRFDTRSSAVHKPCGGGDCVRKQVERRNSLLREHARDEHSRISSSDFACWPSVRTFTRHFFGLRGRKA